VVFVGQETANKTYMALKDNQTYSHMHSHTLGCRVLASEATRDTPHPTCTRCFEVSAAWEVGAPITFGLPCCNPCASRHVESVYSCSYLKVIPEKFLHTTNEEFDQRLL